MPDDAPPLVEVPIFGGVTFFNGQGKTGKLSMTAEDDKGNTYEYPHPDDTTQGTPILADAEMWKNGQGWAVQLAGTATTIAKVTFSALFPDLNKKIEAEWTGCPSGDDVEDVSVVALPECLAVYGPEISGNGCDGTGSDTYVNP